MNPDHPHRLILVTSAAPGEGKTTIACSVAISLAQAGLRTCIVDCDFRRPRLHRIFGRAGDAGLTNLLLGDATLAEVAQSTVVDNLWCVPSGPIPPNPGDMLHSEKFQGILRELSKQFDRVVIDSPPVAAVSDSAVISTVVDGTVFVVRAGKTSHALAHQGLRALADVDAHMIGSVLNAVDFRKNEYSYYQQYYYYRREGYGPLESEGEGGGKGGGGDDEPPRPAASAPN
jgi:capsular exopolysaccharide synthesis family protein